jgi:hypothetical protein
VEVLHFIRTVVGEANIPDAGVRINRMVAIIEDDTRRGLIKLELEVVVSVMKPLVQATSLREKAQ